MVDVPNSVVITRIDGTNHCQTPSAERPPIEPDSNGPNSARNTSGWIIPNSSENGSRSTGFSSRLMTIRMSRTMLRAAAAGRGAVERRWCGSDEGSVMQAALSIGLGFAEAAAGEVEEHVVEGRAMHLRRRDRNVTLLRGA